MQRQGGLLLLPSVAQTNKDQAPQQHQHQQDSGIKQWWKVLSVQEKPAGAWWEMFGAVPVLCSYIGSLGVASVDSMDGSVSVHRDSVNFVAATLAAGLVCTGLVQCAAVYNVNLLNVGSCSCKEKQRQQQQQQNHPRWYWLVGLQAALNLVCSSCLFVLFSQASSASSMPSMSEDLCTGAVLSKTLSACCVLGAGKPK